MQPQPFPQNRPPQSFPRPALIQQSRITQRQFQPQPQFQSQLQPQFQPQPSVNFFMNPAAPATRSPSVNFIMNPVAPAARSPQVRPTQNILTTLVNEVSANIVDAAPDVIADTAVKVAASLIGSLF